MSPLFMAGDSWTCAACSSKGRKICQPRGDEAGLVRGMLGIYPSRWVKLPRFLGIFTWIIGVSWWSNLTNGDKYPGLWGPGTQAFPIWRVGCKQRKEPRGSFSQSEIIVILLMEENPKQPPNIYETRHKKWDICHTNWWTPDFWTINSMSGSDLKCSKGELLVFLMVKLSMSSACCIGVNWDIFHVST